MTKTKLLKIFTLASFVIFILASVGIAQEKNSNFTFSGKFSTSSGKPTGGWTLIMCEDFQGRWYDLLPAMLETESYGDWALIQNGFFKTYHPEYGKIGYELNRTYSFFKYSCKQLNQWCEDTYGEDYANARAYQSGIGKTFPFLIPASGPSDPAHPEHRPMEVCGESF